MDNNEIVGHRDWSRETKLYIGYVESRKAMIDSFGETLSAATIKMNPLMQ